MTTQSASDVRIDRAIEAWLELGPTELPGRVVDAARVEVHRTRQRRAWWAGWSEQLPTRARLAASLGAAGMVIVLVGVGLRLSASPKVGTSPSPSPTVSPTVNGFQPTGSMAINRLDHTATLLLDGRVLIAGGSGWVEDGRPAGSTEPIITASAEIYDPTTGKFTLTGSMTTARAHHTATLLPDGRVLITGGGISGAESDVDPGAQGFALASAEIYDPTTGRFSTTGSMATGRLGASAVRLADGRVVIVGGGTPNGSNYTGDIETAEIYDPTNGVFTPAGTFSGGSFVALMLQSDGRVLGVVTSVTGAGSLEVYNPNSATFGSVGSPPYGCQWICGVALADRRFLFIGADGRNMPLTAANLVAELYDPSTGSLLPTGGTPAIDFQAFTASLLPDGRVLLVGFSGRADAGRPPFAVLYDPATEMFSPASPPPYSGWGQTSTVLSDGRVLTVGGGSNGGRSPASNTAELFTSADP